MTAIPARTNDQERESPVAEAAYSGRLAADVDPLAIGVPHATSLRCFAPDELWNAARRLRMEQDGGQEPGTASWCVPSYSAAPVRHGSDYDLFDHDPVKETERANQARQMPLAKHGERVAQIQHHDMPNAVFGRLAAGELRAFGLRRPPGVEPVGKEIFEWISPEVWRDGARPLNGRPGGIVTNADGGRWWNVHVHDASVGLPLDLAAIAYGNPEAAKDFIEAEENPGAAYKREPAMRMLRADLLKRLRNGEAVATGMQCVPWASSGKRQIMAPSCWPGEWIAGASDWAASTCGQFREVLVRLPLPWAPEDVAKIGGAGDAVDAAPALPAAATSRIPQMDGGPCLPLSVDQHAKEPAPVLKRVRASTARDDTQSLRLMFDMIRRGEAGGPDQAARRLLEQGKIALDAPSNDSHVRRLTGKYRKMELSGA